MTAEAPATSIHREPVPGGDLVWRVDVTYPEGRQRSVYFAWAASARRFARSPKRQRRLLAAIERLVEAHDRLDWSR